MAGEGHLVEDFLATCTPATASCYRRDLAHLHAYLSARGAALLGARPAELRAYVAACEAAGAAPATIRRRLAAAGSLYRYLLGEGHVASSPVERLRRPRGSSAPRLGLDTASLQRLWELACQKGGTAQLLIGLLLFAGLRISEALGLDSEDVRRHDGRLYAEVQRKGGTRGLVAFVAPLDVLVEAAIAAQGEGPLLEGARGGRLSRQRAWELVRAVGNEAAVPVYPHLLRHSHVTQALATGVSLVAVQASAGHRDPRTTAHYAQGLLAVAGEAGAAVAASISADPLVGANPTHH